MNAGGTHKEAARRGGRSPKMGFAAGYVVMQRALPAIRIACMVLRAIGLGACKFSSTSARGGAVPDALQSALRIAAGDLTPAS